MNPSQPPDLDPRDHAYPSRSQRSPTLCTYMPLLYIPDPTMHTSRPSSNRAWNLPPKIQPTRPITRQKSYPLSSLTISNAPRPHHHPNLHLSTRAALTATQTPYLPPHLPTFYSIYLPLYLPSTLLTYLTTYLPPFYFTYLPPYLPPYLPTFHSLYLPTYLPTFHSTSYPRPQKQHTIHPINETNTQLQIYQRR